MTTTPNDAAVNAESAAKLVSDEMVQQACAVYNETPAADGEVDLVVCDPDAMRAALEAVAANLIERHATPQTQATHGEGEAVAHDMQSHPRDL